MSQPSRRYSYHLSLVLVLLVGLVISLIPVGSAIGSPSQSQPALSSSLVVEQLQQPPMANLTSNSLVRYSHTLLLGSSGSATQNGTALLAAMTTIANANPSAANPYLLKLEPGQYDLGSASLTLLPYVDLEGSGEVITVISSTIGSSSNPVTNGTLIVVSNTETRFLKIANSSTATNTYQTSIYIPATTTNVHFTDLDITASGGINSFGIFNSYGSMATVQNSTFTVSGDINSWNYGLLNLSSGTVTVQNSTLNVSGGQQSVSLYNNLGGTITVQNSNLTASKGVVPVGFYNLGGMATVQNSTLTAYGGSTNSYSLANTGTVRIGASQLSGGIAPLVGTTTCVASYNINFVALSSTCL
ncbi:MAG: hypothetical protein HXX20_09620 [Chloroflexi bacterium]|nr:hypothetical protein [Chloroflexota bacterium]